MSLRISSQTPVRMDLAGGTIDIWPVYLFVPGAVTTNLGINLFAKTELFETPDGVLLKSLDQNTELNLSWDEIRNLPEKLPPGVIIHARLLRFFLKLRESNFGPVRGGLTLSTQATSPAGAGLGGSSALGISMIGALNTWATGKVENQTSDRERFISIMKDIESQVLRAPAGLQDYYGAAFGGLQTIRWGVHRHERQEFPHEILSGLHERLILFYSGTSRNSGINNWQIFKDYIDKYEPVIDKLTRIAQATHKLNEALPKSDWKSVGDAISQEWEARKTLAAGISTEAIDGAFKKAQDESKKVSLKICGAGGGGCFFVYTSEPDAGLRQRIIEKVSTGGIRHLPFEPVTEGLKISGDLKPS